MKGCVAFNKELEKKRRSAGPFYFEGRTHSVQCVSSRVVRSCVVAEGQFVEVEMFAESVGENAHKQQTKALGRELDRDAERAKEPKVRDETLRPSRLQQVADYPSCPACTRDVEVSSSALACTLCNNTYHGSCVQLTPLQVHNALKVGCWQCVWCKQCLVCGNGYDEDALVLCDSCDSCYHIYCLQPALNAVPEGGWRCRQCVRCIYCATDVSERWWENCMVCNSCEEKKRRGFVCPVCLLPDSDGEAAVSCEMCQRWVHVNGSCDGGLTEADWKEIQGRRMGFVCATCEAKPVETKDTLRDKLNTADIDRMLEEQKGVNPAAAAQKAQPAPVVKSRSTAVRKKRRKRYSDDEEDYEDISSSEVEEVSDDEDGPGKRRSDQESFVCGECDRVFSNRQARLTHMAMHKRQAVASLSDL